MNNSINSVNNISFNARYLKFHNKDEMPAQVYRAIQESNAINEFLNAGKPKNLLEKFIDFFKKDEILDVYYELKKISPIDPFAQKEGILFTHKKTNKKNRYLPVMAFQNGIRRKPGVIPRENEHKVFKVPTITSTEKLIKKIEALTDLEACLKEKI